MLIDVKTPEHYSKRMSIALRQSEYDRLMKVIPQGLSFNSLINQLVLAYTESMEKAAAKAKK